MINKKFFKKYTYFKSKKIKSFKLLKNQGLSNTSYLLKTSKKSFVVRVFTSKKTLHVNRKFEFTTQKKAFKLGIAPKPILLDKKHHLMISKFTKGKHKFKLNQKDLKSLANVLKKLHTIKRKDKKVLCHHDLNPKNILFTKTIKLIDWEYARFNDKYLDIAAILIEFNLNTKEQKYFLKSYFKTLQKVNNLKLKHFKKRYKKLCEKWLESTSIIKQF